MRAPRRHPCTSVAPPDTGAAFVRLIKRRLTNPDPRSHAEFLADMQAKQAAGMLHNPATASLLNRLEQAIAS